MLVRDCIRIGPCRFSQEFFDCLLTWRLLMLVGCSLLRCVLFHYQSTMCFLTRATQLCLASLPAPSASSPEPRSIRYFWVRSRFVHKLALSFTFHFAVFDSTHWPWVLVGRVGKSERLTVASRFPSISRHDVDHAALTRTSVRKNTRLLFVELLLLAVPFHVDWVRP